MYIIENIDYENDADKVLDLIGNYRTVVIKNKTAVSAENLIKFYKKLGRVVKQNEYGY